MAESMTAFTRFVHDSAERYVQTVVLIDDRIYGAKTTTAPSELLIPAAAQRKPALKLSEDEVVKPKVETLEEASEEVSFQDVQSSFADRRIICSLFQPEKSLPFGESSIVYGLCSVADAVIVDWDMYGDSGGKAKELVGCLVEHSVKDIPHQLRLILIYTLEPNLGGVASDIYDDLAARIGKDNIIVKQGEELVLSTGSARIVVLGKRVNDSLLEYAAYRVPEKELAARTVAEFSQLASGLLQGIALRGVAAIRENGKRILARFGESLDVAFLTHRALLLPNEALAQVVPLLAEEMRAVLEDVLGEKALGSGVEPDEIIEDWCLQSWAEGSDAKDYIGRGGDAKRIAADLLSKGPKIKGSYSGTSGTKLANIIDRVADVGGVPTWKGKCLDLTKFLVPGPEGELLQQQLASLMSQRIAYAQAHKTLRLGVIVRESAGEQRYLMCLQPVCDSVRLRDRKTTFVFCILGVPNGENEPFTHTVLDFSGRPVRLVYSPKATASLSVQFETCGDAILAVEVDNQCPCFNDSNGNKYVWIAELKSEHAQRAAEDYGRTLSRIGLTESEWLRLRSR